MAVLPHPGGSRDGRHRHYGERPGLYRNVWQLLAPRGNPGGRSIQARWMPRRARLGGYARILFFPSLPREITLNDLPAGRVAESESLVGHQWAGGSGNSPSAAQTRFGVFQSVVVTPATSNASRGDDRQREDRRRWWRPQSGRFDHQKRNDCGQLCDRRWHDNIKGGAGNDRLFGQAGKDKLSGGSGSDRCDGGPGRDTITTCEPILNLAWPAQLRWLRRPPPIPVARRGR